MHVGSLRLLGAKRTAAILLHGVEPGVRKGQALAHSRGTSNVKGAAPNSCVGTAFLLGRFFSVCWSSGARRTLFVGAVIEFIEGINGPNVSLRK